MRLCNRGRYRAAGDVVMLMVAKYIVPETSIWYTVVRGLCHTKRVRKVIDKCWDDIWRR
uniref:Pentatricopeptide repeat-containing protein n=1 Tax=Arundo donax TaxID=35708 RepID=A0A0A8XWS8_ARUDO